MRIDIFAKYDKIAYKSIDNVSLMQPDEHELWAGGVIDFTYDNTRNPLINIYYGTRGKVFLNIIKAY